MPSVKLSPLFNDQTFTSSGAPASGYQIKTYAADSSSPLATYTDSTGNTPQSNPIILDTNGYPTNGQIWLQANNSYKFVLQDANGVAIKTFDNISGVNDTTSTVSQWQSSGVTPTYVSATSFSLAGDQTTDFHSNRRLQFTVIAGTVYGTIANSAYNGTSLTTVTMTMNSGQSLDTGLSAVNLSMLRADNAATPEIISAGRNTSVAYASGKPTIASTTVQVPVRQTVLTSSVDTNGSANFLSPGTGLSVNLFATATPITLAFAAGFDAYGLVDYIGRITADVTAAWSSLTASSTLYLYIDRNTSTGALTYGFTSLVPNYGYGITKSTTNGQHTYRIDEGVMYVGNGSTASAVQRVFVGECVTSGSTLTSLTPYSLQGRYISPDQAIPSVAGTAVSVNHNIGLAPKLSSYLRCVTADSGYAVGDLISVSSFDAGSSSFTWGINRTAAFVNWSVTNFGIANKSTGVRSGFTPANWKHVFICERGW